MDVLSEEVIRARFLARKIGLLTRAMEPATCDRNIVSSGLNWKSRLAYKIIGCVFIRWRLDMLVELYPSSVRDGTANCLNRRLNLVVRREKDR